MVKQTVKRVLNLFAVISAAGMLFCAVSCSMGTGADIKSISGAGGIDGSLNIAAVSGSVALTESGGWMESAYVEWKPASGLSADGYNVYIKAAGAEYTKLDGMLVREYSGSSGSYSGTYYRADALGLAPGVYQFKVAAVSAGTETGTAAETSGITVTAYDRSGYAFTGAVTPGAYKADGTLKDGAVVLYVSNSTKDTVSMDVSGAANPCVGLQAILDGYKKGKETRPLAVRLIGNLTDLSYMLGGDIVVENANGTTGITIEGVGDDAVANGWGLRIKNGSYIEVRNIGFMNCDSSEGDNVGLQQNDFYVWVHNCDMFYGNAGSDADQIKGDGALDCKKSSYITFSYNHFWDNGKSNLLGLSEGIKSYESGAYYITYHHNWYDHSDSRHPRARFYNAHVYNNYYDGIAKYGAGSTQGSSVFMEANYFRSCKYPMMISMQGSDVYSTGSVRDTKNNPTFSSEDGGIIKAYNNYMTGTYTFVPYGAEAIVTSGTAGSAAARGINTSADFDAYVVANRSDTVPSSIKSYQGSNYYSNFDTQSSMYSYTADSPENAKTNVMSFAGRMNGGDFTWTFNNSAEDTNSAVIPALKAALTNYTGSMVRVLGDGGSSGSGGSGGGSEPGEGGGDSGGVTADSVCTFTAGGAANSAFAVTGNTSNTKGTCTVNGTQYTYCLKMESSTVITFTTDRTMTLTLVFGGTTSALDKKVKIDGIAYAAEAAGANYTVTQSLAAGTHTVTKGDSINLFYIALSASD